MEKYPDRQAVRNHEPQKKQWVEPVTVLVMALTTLGTAWCPYQSAARTRRNYRATIFGSARLKPDTVAFDETVALVRENRAAWLAARPAR